LPVWPQYCRATPTEHVPFFGKPVSSMIQAWIGSMSVMLGSTSSRTRVNMASSCHGDSPTMCSSDWCCAAVRSGAVRAASGSTL
jgi:hypothetical protein